MAPRNGAEAKGAGQPLLDASSSDQELIDSPVAKWYLYGSYFMAAWAWRFAEFLYALLMISLFPNNLILVSVYGLLDNAVRLLLGPAVGSYIDRHELHNAARVMYWIQNGCITFSTACATILLNWVIPEAPAASNRVTPQASAASYWFTPQAAAANAWAITQVRAVITRLVPQLPPANTWDDQTYQMVFWGLAALVMLFGALSSAGSMGISISVERKMVKALCKDDGSMLGSINSGMRAIDLTSLLLAPMLAGVLMTFCGQPIAVLVLCGYTTAAWLPELQLLSAAHKRSAALRAANAPQEQAAIESSLPEDAAHDGTQAEADVDVQPGTAPSQSTSESWLLGFYRGWQTYYKQDVLLANLALAILYCTVLSLGFLMTAFLRWCGMSEAEVSLYRGVGAIAGLLATWVFPPMNACMGAKRMGLIGSYYQLTCLCFGVLPMVYASLQAFSDGTESTGPPATWIIRLLVIGVVASRTGLWIFDLAVTQIVQDKVPHHELGVVSGVQGSIQAAMETLSFIAGITFNDPSKFFLLLAGSLAVVASASLLFSTYACTHRGPAVTDSLQYSPIPDGKEDVEDPDRMRLGADTQPQSSS